LPPTSHGASATPSLPFARTRSDCHSPQPAASEFSVWLRGTVWPQARRVEPRPPRPLASSSSSAATRSTRSTWPPSTFALERRFNRMVALADIERHLLGARRPALPSPIPCESRTRPLPEACLHAHASVRHPLHLAYGLSLSLVGQLVCAISFEPGHHPVLSPHLQHELRMELCSLCSAAAAVSGTDGLRVRMIGTVWSRSECVWRVWRSCRSPRVYVEPLRRCMCLVYVQNLRVARMAASGECAKVANK
jgi:hypothetical protein